MGSQDDQPPPSALPNKPLRRFLWFLPEVSAVAATILGVALITSLLMIGATRRTHLPEIAFSFLASWFGLVLILPPVILSSLLRMTRRPVIAILGGLAAGLTIACAFSLLLGMAYYSIR